MLNIDLSMAPPCPRVIAAQKQVLRLRERMHIGMLGLVLLLLAWLGATLILNVTSRPAMSMLGLVCAARLAYSVGRELLTIAGQFAQLEPVNPVELVQVPTLTQQSMVNAAYVERVTASGRALLGVEYSALVLEAERTYYAAKRIDTLAGAFHEVQRA
jgi:hypothetical protein